MKPVYFNFKGRRQSGVVVVNNCHTVWVRIMMGATDYILIKRHKRKHKVWPEKG